MINSPQKDRVIAVLMKYNLKKQKMADLYIEDGSNIAADLSGKEPKIGVWIVDKVQTEKHGVLRVQDIVNEVAAAMKFKSSAPEQKGSNPVSGGISKGTQSRQVSEPTKPIPGESKLGAGDTQSKSEVKHENKSNINTSDEQSGIITSDPGDRETNEKGGQESPLKNVTATCEGCSTKMQGSIVEFQEIEAKYNGIYCPDCVTRGKYLEKAKTPEADKDKKVARNVPATPSKPDIKASIIKTCDICGLELSGARALECFEKDPQKPRMICEGCENKHDEAKHQEAQKGKDAQAEKREARPEESKIAEAVKLQQVARQPDARIPMQTYTSQGSIIKGFQPSLKEIGKIKIGGKGEERPKAGGGTFRLPVKFDHFEIVSLTRDDKGDLIRDPIMDSLGDKPQSLDIMLLFNDPTLNFVSRYNQYHGGKCLCQGDGIKATVSIPDKDGNKIIDCDPDTCPQFAQKKCKPNGILSVILTKSPRLGGVYKFRTTSFNSIRSILSSLFFLSNLTGGVLAMIPLKLTVSPMQVQPKDSTKPQTIFVVNIEFSGTAPELLQKTFDVQKYQSAMRENIIKLESTARAVLTAPESKEEIKDIEAEFYPEKQEVK